MIRFESISWGDAKSISSDAWMQLFDVQTACSIQIVKKLGSLSISRKLGQRCFCLVDWRQCLFNFDSCAGRKGSARIKVLAEGQFPATPEQGESSVVRQPDILPFPIWETQWFLPSFESVLCERLDRAEFKHKFWLGKWIISGYIFFFFSLFFLQFIIITESNVTAKGKFILSV